MRRAGEAISIRGYSTCSWRSCPRSASSGTNSPIEDGAARQLKFARQGGAHGHDHLQRMQGKDFRPGVDVPALRHRPGAEPWRTRCRLQGPRPPRIPPLAFRRGKTALSQASRSNTLVKVDGEKALLFNISRGGMLCPRRIPQGDPRSTSSWKPATVISAQGSGALGERQALVLQPDRFRGGDHRAPPAGYREFVEQLDPAESGLRSAHDDPVLALFLGQVHGLIGALDELLHALAFAETPTPKLPVTRAGE